MDLYRAPGILTSHAVAAENAAKGLSTFLTHVLPEDTTAITLLISKHYELSSDLRRLAITVERLPVQFEFRFDDIYDGLEHLLRSLRITIDDFQGIIGQGFLTAREDRLPLPAQHVRVWEDLVIFFEDQSGNSLCQRLEYYRSCATELKNILLGG